MKAIILAAGCGTRLRPLTDDRPKCLVEFYGKPILEHILATLNACAVENTILVTGYCKHQLERFKLKSYFNERYHQTNMVATLFCAESEFDDDIIISYADIVYRPRILQALIDSQHAISVCVDTDWLKQWKKRMSNPLQDAETLILDGDLIKELGKKPKGYEDIHAQYMGLIKISKQSLASVREFYHSLDKQKLYDGKNFDNMYMTSFIQELINYNFLVHGVKVENGWCEIDALSDLNNEWPD